MEYAVVTLYALGYVTSFRLMEVLCKEGDIEEAGLFAYIIPLMWPLSPFFWAFWKVTGLDRDRD